jgi:uncharacterized protein (UPF0264 family)
MLVLVSVRSAGEVKAAVAGGADVIDAKEPDRGPLGQVSAPTLEAIARAVPAPCVLSVALGDPSDHPALAEAFSGLRGLSDRGLQLILKVGLARVSGRPALDSLLASAGRLVSALQVPARVMAVASVDLDSSLERVTAAAAAAGLDGVVLDTARKDGRSLFDWVDDSTLRRWIEGARARGLRTGLAGSLSREGIGRAAGLGPDIVGARGAACRGGRGGQVDEGLVRSLVAAVRGGCKPSEALL